MNNINNINNDSDSTNTQLTQNANVRRRGRPRKNQQIMDKKPKPIKENNFNVSDEEEIILHLPISLKDFSTKNKINIFKPKESSTGSGKDITDITDTQICLTLSDNEPHEKTSVVNEIKEKDKIIKKLKDEIHELKNMVSEMTNTTLMDTRITKLNAPIITISNGKTIVPEKVNTACLWCGYDILNDACVLPDKFLDGIYHVIGYFCIHGCSVSYNFYVLNDYKQWERYSLLKSAYGISDDIPEAPAREAFERYGGPINHDAYIKKYMYCDKEYRIIIPPMVSIVPFIEERNKNQFINKFSANYDTNLKIKRNKPLPNSKNTLIETMGIKYKN